MSNLRDIERSLIPLVRNQMDALKYLYGVYTEVYRTVEHDSIYNRIELTYTYEPVPYYRGYLLVTGLHPNRDVIDYWWKVDDVYLWIPKHNHFLPQPNWKINIINDDMKNSFRITDEPVITGYHFIMCYKYQLVPYNEPELKDFN
jgi:hypothetical protein